MPTSKSDDEGRGVLFSTVKGRKGLSPAGGDFGYARQNRCPAKRGTTRMGWLGRTPVRAPGPPRGEAQPLPRSIMIPLLLIPLRFVRAGDLYSLANTSLEQAQ